MKIKRKKLTLAECYGKLAILLWDAYAAHGQTSVYHSWQRVVVRLSRLQGGQQVN